MLYPHFFCPCGGVIVYAALILKLKGITAEEIERLPKGSKIVEILRLKGGKH